MALLHHRAGSLEGAPCNIPKVCCAKLHPSPLKGDEVCAQPAEPLRLGDDATQEFDTGWFHEVFTFEDFGTRQDDGCRGAELVGCACNHRSLASSGSGDRRKGSSRDQECNTKRCAEGEEHDENK